MSSDLLPSCTRLQLSGDVDIYSAQQLKSSLIAALAEHALVQVDLSGVRNIDCAGLQVLALIHRECGSTGKTMRLIGCSEAVIAQIRIVGMHNYFGYALLADNVAEEWELAA